VLSEREANELLKDLREAVGHYECSVQDFLDFMTRQRINVVSLEKGFVDPLVAQICTKVLRVCKVFDVVPGQCFKILVGKKSDTIRKPVFLRCMQGMQLGAPIEDLINLFNYMVSKEQNSNVVHKNEFEDSISSVTSKLGGRHEIALATGAVHTKKGHSMRQQAIQILTRLSKVIQERNLSLRQILRLFDVEQKGYVGRAQFAEIIKSLEAGISLEDQRLLFTYFEESEQGEISVV